MLRIKLFKWVAALVLVFGVLSAFLGIRTIGRRVVGEAQARVRLDLNSAWDVCHSQLRDTEHILKLTVAHGTLARLCSDRQWENPRKLEQVSASLGKIRLDFGLDFLTVVSSKGRVVARAAPCTRTGDFRLTEPIIADALKGRPASGLALFTREELAHEGPGLADKAFMSLQPTPHARRSPRTAEDRGMVMMAAAPIERDGKVLGAVYAGILLNRNHAFVDRIQKIVYGEESYDGLPLGTVTVFLADARVTTTVRHADGDRAYGTRVSGEVAERVLDNERRWVGRAFVVRDWYLTAYDPIQNHAGQVIGMLYVGILERPFSDLNRSIVVRYSALCAAVLVVALILAFIIAARISRPLQRLAAASDRMRSGHDHQPVPPDNSCKETATLIRAFNEMAQALGERERQLRKAGNELAETNASLTELNRSYMETVQFVTHELKSPVAAVLSHVHLLRKRFLGPVPPKQDEVLGRIEANLERLLEMIGRYLSLARIERQELRPHVTRVPLLSEVVAPAVDAAEPDICGRGMRVDNRVPADVALRCDVNMTREVFDNLLSNAVKYGRKGGLITLDCKAEGEWAACTVRNEGQGIPPEKMTRLFQKFSYADSRDMAKHSRGTGLGLFITRQIVEAHGGAITADSRPGEWAEFRCTFRLWTDDDLA